MRNSSVHATDLVSAGCEPAQPRARQRRQGGLLRTAWPLILLFVVSSPAVTPRIYASDEAQYFAFLRSLWFDHDVSFDNEYRHFYESGMTRTDLFRDTFLKPTTETGLRRNFGTIGCAILWSPFYALTDAGVRVARLAGSDVPADGYSRPYVAAVALASAVYGLLALLLSLGVARRVVPGFAATSRMRQLTPVMVAWLATPLVFYMYVAPLFAHACSAFIVSAFVLMWMRVRDRWTPAGLMGLGVLAALMTMVREQDAIYAAAPALDFAWMFADRSLHRAPGTGDEEPGPIKLLIAAIAGGAAFAVTFLPQALVYLALNGRVGPDRLVSRKLIWTAPHALQVLFSPEHGFLVWTPIAVLAIAGLVMLASRPLAPAPAPLMTRTDVRRVAICLLVMAACAVYMAGSLDSWTVAGAFGQRRFVGLTVALVVGLAVVVSRVWTKWARVALGVVLAIGVWWNVGLMVQFGSGMMDRERLEPLRNAYTTFVVVPVRLPGIAYRYMFDRQSFYRPARDTK